MGQIKNIRVKRPLTKEELDLGVLTELPSEYKSPVYCQGYRDAWAKVTDLLDWMMEMNLDPVTQIDVLLRANEDWLKEWSEGCGIAYAEMNPAIDRLVELAQRLMPILEEQKVEQGEKVGT
jgi:hypothetical protein